jgi:hypothetical protein
MNATIEISAPSWDDVVDGRCRQNRLSIFADTLRRIATAVENGRLDGIVEARADVSATYEIEMPQAPADAA